MMARDTKAAETGGVPTRDELLRLSVTLLERMPHTELRSLAARIHEVALKLGLDTGKGR